MWHNFSTHSLDLFGRPLSCPTFPLPTMSWLVGHIFWPVGRPLSWLIISQLAEHIHGQPFLKLVDHYLGRPFSSWSDIFLIGLFLASQPLTWLTISKQLNIFLASQIHVRPFPGWLGFSLWRLRMPHLLKVSENGSLLEMMIVVYVCLTR